MMENSTLFLGHVGSAAFACVNAANAKTAVAMRAVAVMNRSKRLSVVSSMGFLPMLVKAEDIAVDFAAADNDLVVRCLGSTALADHGGSSFWL